MDIFLHKYIVYIFLHKCIVSCCSCGNPKITSPPDWYVIISDKTPVAPNFTKYSIVLTTNRSVYSKEMIFCCRRIPKKYIGSQLKILEKHNFVG